MNTGAEKHLLFRWGTRAEKHLVPGRGTGAEKHLLSRRDTSAEKHLVSREGYRYWKVLDIHKRCRSWKALVTLSTSAEEALGAWVTVPCWKARRTLLEKVSACWKATARHVQVNNYWKVVLLYNKKCQFTEKWIVWSWTLLTEEVTSWTQAAFAEKHFAGHQLALICWKANTLCTKRC